MSKAVRIWSLDITKTFSTVTRPCESKHLQLVTGRTYPFGSAVFVPTFALRFLFPSSNIMLLGEALDKRVDIAYTGSWCNFVLLVCYGSFVALVVIVWIVAHGLHTHLVESGSSELFVHCLENGNGIADAEYGAEMMADVIHPLISQKRSI
ncbi:uncharacterized protein LY89DRAFT_124910 [Mollisia scopiformis]|uniref:Uncharacterized protein n=1 Tax=Mollisia scopiformis TaxID=149040 RepID=A0A194X405_MOLSC|nr:uncharacterized protein LY89DRAFT_124910 [Mollisia scopiformis]KUJ14920.1 hypothetical protein LY89DRAFT_124910 [Mollisia scopiformis]